MTDTIQDEITQSGLTLTQLSAQYGIPYRSVQDRNVGRRLSPGYIVKLLKIATEKQQG